MPDNLLSAAATWLVPLVFAIVFHEIAHGWAALALGDPTARDQRRLSPNPVRHIDPFGTVLLPLTLAVTGAPIFGWARPVPSNLRNLRNPRVDSAVIAFAGPATNLLLALAAATLVSVLRPTISAGGPAWHLLGYNLINFVTINLFLAVLNLLPVPPFDGGKVIQGLLPRGLASRYMRLNRIALPILVLLLLVGPMLGPSFNIVGRLVRPPVDFLTRLLLPGLG